MTDTNHTNLAEILRHGAAGYAARATELLLERVPNAATAFGTAAFRNWQGHLAEHLNELAASIELSDRTMFEANVRWNARAFARRNVPRVYLEAALQALADALEESLPQADREQIVRSVRAATAAIAEAETLQPEISFSPLALQYLEAALCGRTREAIDLVVHASLNGTGPSDMYEKVLLPVQAHVGQMWHDGEVAIWEEHLVTEITRAAMSIIAHRAPRQDTSKPTVLLGTLSEDTHSLGLRATSDLLDLAGYHVVNLGANLPESDWISAITALKPKIVIVSVALRTGLARVRQLVSLIRQQCPGDEIRFVAGGPALQQVAISQDQLHVDAVAGSPSDAVAIADTLCT